MAGDWIKMRGNLWDDPRIGRLCDGLEQPEAMVIGALYWLWAMADQHTEDGILPGLTLRSIDRKTGVSGFAQALCDLGWLADHPEGVRIVNFEEHNGTSAKRRCTEAQRKANARSVSASDADNLRTEAGQIPPKPGAREEKRREEEKTTSARPTVPCPYTAIVDRYHSALPSLPKAKLMPPARQKAMREFWAWVLSSTRGDGARRATNADEALTWIGDYFTRAADNDFLTGRSARGGEHANWRCDIDFLLTDKGKKHVIEKTEAA